MKAQDNSDIHSQRHTWNIRFVFLFALILEARVSFSGPALPFKASTSLTNKVFLCMVEISSHYNNQRKMARSRRQARRPPVVPPKFSMPFLTWLTIGFFALIAFFFVIPFGSNKSNADGLSIQQLQNKHRVFQSPNDIPTAILAQLDAVLVLGGGVPTSIDHPPVYVERRCDDAVAVYERRNGNELLAQHKVFQKGPLSFLCLSAGTAHLPQRIGPDGLPVWESTACASYILQQQRSIQPSQLFVETTSYDTIGNAFFARTTHTDINGWRKLLVVTNAFHMERTRAIFDWIFMQCTATKDESTTKRRQSSRHSSNSNPYELYYLESPDVGLTQDAVQARKEREVASLKTLREKLIPNMTTLPQVYQFLTQEHALYTAHKLVERGRGGSDNDTGASEQVKKSYGGK